MTPTASSLGRALRRRHWLLWGTAVVAAALALGATFVRPPTYEASTLLSIDETQATAQGFDVAMQADQFLTQRFVSLATSATVLSAVCDRQGPGCDAGQLARRVRVTTPKATGQIVVVADAPTPQAAARLANDVATELIARNRSLVEDRFAGQRKVLQGQVQDLTGKLATALQQSQAAEAGGRSDGALLAQLSLLQNQYSTASQRLSDLDVQQSQLSDMLSVVQPATPPDPDRPVDPDPVRYAGVGLVAGLAAGFLLALLLERLGYRLSRGSELAEATGCRLVLDLSRGRSGTAGLTALPALAGLEAGEDGRRALLVVACSHRDPVNDVALDLAGAALDEGQRALVAMATLPNGVPVERGEVRVGEAGSALLVPAIEAGGRRPAELGRPTKGFDLVLGCAGPPHEYPSAARLRGLSDRALLVATRGGTRAGEASRAAGALRELGVDVVAAVLLPRRNRRAARAAARDRRPAPQAKPALEP